jgi:hypothetical protein
MTGDRTLRVARFAQLGKAKRLLFARPADSAINSVREIVDLVVIKTHLSHGFSLERMITLPGRSAHRSRSPSWLDRNNVW